MVAVVASLAALVATPGGAAHRKYRIAYLTYVNMAKGANAAAKRLGIQIVGGKCGPPCTSANVIKLYNAMITRRVDAIVSDGYNTWLTPTLRKARKAGILVISSGDDIAGKRDLWVSQTGPVAYGEALADALARQIGGKGEYAIMDESDENPVAVKWKNVVTAYVAKAYPKMKLDGILTAGEGGGSFEPIKTFIADHSQLRGLIAITPTQTYNAAEAITQSGRIGQVFSAGNGGSSISDPQLIAYVRTGAAELVYASNPIKLGYLTVWGAHHLLTGHRFASGAYQVGPPIGLVYYYAKHRELRLGQPLTITKSNIDRYANQF